MICPKCEGIGWIKGPGWARSGEIVPCPHCLGTAEIPKPHTDQLRLECDDQRELSV